MTTDEVSVLVYSLMLIVLFAGVVESQGQGSYWLVMNVWEFWPASLKA